MRWIGGLTLEFCVEIIFFPEMTGGRFCGILKQLFFVHIHCFLSFFTKKYEIVRENSEAQPCAS
jgi:hypothetical protein